MKTLSLKMLQYVMVSLFFMSAASSYAQTNVQSQGATAFENHSIYMHEVITVNFGILFPYASYSPQDIAAVENRLSVSSLEIGNFFAQFYGANTGNLITSFFQNYNNYALQMINATKTNNHSQVQQLYAQWQSYGIAIANYLNSTFDVKLDSLLVGHHVNS